jgi:hypothetical protein
MDVGRWISVGALISTIFISEFFYKVAYIYERNTNIYVL